VPLYNCHRCGRTYESEVRHRCPDCGLLRKRRTAAGLTFRDWQIIELIQKGKLNKKISWELHLTEGTIKLYINHIFRKTGTSNRTQLAMWALGQRA